MGNTKKLLMRLTSSFQVNLVLYFGVMFLILTGIADIMSSFNIRWQWFRMPQFFFIFEDGEWYAGPMVEGLIVTLQVSFLAFPLTCFFGLTASLMARSDLWSLKQISRSYIGFIRNTPLIVQLYILYFLISPAFGLDRFWVGVFALALFEGAYAAEIFRSGIESVSKYQIEAAKSIGLNRALIGWKIIFPQALKFVVPPLTNLIIALIKHSSIVSIIAVEDLTNASRNIIAETFLNFEVWFITGGVYLFLALVLGLIVRVVEKSIKVAPAN